MNSLYVKEQVPRDAGTMPEPLFARPFSVTEVREKYVLRIMHRVFTIGLSHRSVGRWGFRALHDKPFRSVLRDRPVPEKLSKAAGFESEEY